MKTQAIRDFMFGLIGKGESKTDFAAILGVHRSTIHKWLRTGNIRLPPRGPRLCNWKLTVEHEAAIIAHNDSSPGQYSVTPYKIRSESIQSANCHQHCRPCTQTRRYLSQESRQKKHGVRRPTWHAVPPTASAERSVTSGSIYEDPLCLNCAP